MCEQQAEERYPTGAPWRWFINGEGFGGEKPGQERLPLPARFFRIKGECLGPHEPGEQRFSGTVTGNFRIDFQLLGTQERSKPAEEPSTSRHLRHLYTLIPDSVLEE